MGIKKRFNIVPQVNLFLLDAYVAFPLPLLQRKIRLVRRRAISSFFAQIIGSFWGLSEALYAGPCLYRRRRTSKGRARNQICPVATTRERGIIWAQSHWPWSALSRQYTNLSFALTTIIIMRRDESGRRRQTWKRIFSTLSANLSAGRVRVERRAKAVERPMRMFLSAKRYLKFNHESEDDI